MRRVMVMAAVMALLVSVMSGTASAGRAGKTAAGVNPHFIMDSTGVRLGDQAYGDLEFYFKVAGLGKNGAADVYARGGLTLNVGCLYTRGNNVDRVVEPRERTQRVNVRTVYGDSSGNATGQLTLNGRTVCSRNGTVAWVTGVWDTAEVAIFLNGSELVNETRTLANTICFTATFQQIDQFTPLPCP